jgi:hypothetical protein
MTRKCVWICQVIFLVSLSHRAFPVASPEAEIIASRTIAALTNNSPLTDVTLRATVSRTVGTDNETGTSALIANGKGQSRVDLDFESGKTTETRYLGNGFAFGSLASIDGKETPLAGQNCLTDPAWFFPAFTSISDTNPTVVLSYVGIEQRKGVSVYHLRSYQASNDLALQFSPEDGLSQLTDLSTMDFYIDGTTFLPVAAVFNAHPDNNALTNIPVEIDYSNYQSVDGLMVPFRIQKVFQGVPLLDFAVTSIAVNTGALESTASAR